MKTSPCVHYRCGNIQIFLMSVLILPASHIRAFISQYAANAQPKETNIRTGKKNNSLIPLNSNSFLLILRATE